MVTALRVIKRKKILPLFKTYHLAKNVWSKIIVIYPNPNNSSFKISIYWLEHLWSNKNWYNKIFHNLLAKGTTIIWLSGTIGMML